MTQKKKVKENALKYAMGYLDKLANLNQSQGDKQTGMLLGDYQWASNSIVKEGLTKPLDGMKQMSKENFASNQIDDLE